MPAVDLTPYYQPPASTSDGTKFDNLLALLQTTLNGLDQFNFASGKIFDPSKLMQNSALDQQALIYDTASGTWKPGPLSYRKVTQKDVVNSAAATDLLNGEITIGAGVMGTSRKIRAKLLCDYLNNTGAGRNITIDIALGGTSLWKQTVSAISASATRQILDISFDIANQNAANVQFTSGTVAFSGPNAATTGIGNGASTSIIPFGSAGTTAIDTATAKALTVQVTHSVADPNLSCRLQAALVEIV